MNNANERKLWIGFDVKGEAGPCLRPTSLEFWKDDKFKHTQPEQPLHYRSDALVGLAAIHLNQHLKNPFSSPKMNYPFCFEAWQALEPHHELYMRSQPRVKALQAQLQNTPSPLTSSFEGSFGEILEGGFQPWGVQLEELTDLVDAINFLEGKMEKPLLYNFNLKLSRPFVDRLHFLHSLLFNLRSLIAFDHNSFIQDPTHEAIKVDSITDYLAKAEYVANDALLYYNFKKMKERLGPAAAEDLEKDFRHYSHNGYCLIESLPKSFLASLNRSDLEETLYLVQMDWLLGTDAGLLFRIREELYGLQEGYDQIFWPDLSPNHKTPHGKLSISCELTESNVFPTSEVA